MLPIKFGFRETTRTVGLVVMLLVAIPSFAAALTISSTATTFRGAPLSLIMTIDDASPLADPGDLVVTLELEEGSNIGDLRGFFAHIADESLLDGLSVLGADVGSAQFAANDVVNVGDRVFFNVAGSPCPCDFGFQIGQRGIAGGDDIQSTTFILSHVSQDLTLDLFADQSFGIFVDSVARIGKVREVGAVSKLSGIVVVPEPSTALLMLFGLAGLTASGQKLRPRTQR